MTVFSSVLSFTGPKFFQSFKSYVLVLIFLVTMASLPSCSKNGSSGNKLTVKRIQYDVPIKNTEAETDWWVQNIEGSARDEFVQSIISRVADGKTEAYDFFTYKKLLPDEISRMMKQVDSISIESPLPPYELIDTVLVTEIRLRDITKLRFLEEWQMDAASLAFSKKVIGLCPLAERYDESGELRGYKPLFWVFFDKKYPAALQLQPAGTTAD